MSDSEAKINVIAGYASVGAWLGAVAWLCGLHTPLGAANTSLALAGLGALVGAYRLRRIYFACRSMTSSSLR